MFTANVSIDHKNVTTLNTNQHKNIITITDVPSDCTQPQLDSYLHSYRNENALQLDTIIPSQVEQLRMKVPFKYSLEAFLCQCQCRSRKFISVPSGRVWSPWLGWALVGFGETDVFRCRGKMWTLSASSRMTHSGVMERQFVQGRDVESE